jgi:tellurite resistance protein
MNTSPAPTDIAHTGDRLSHLPVSLFSSVMGITGLAIAWKKAHLALGVSEIIWQGLAIFGNAIFVLLLTLYAVKILRYRDEVLAEWHHPVRVNFFPTISIGLLLLGIVWLENSPQLAYILWMIGALLHLSFTFAILSSWLHHTHYAIQHANPAWFIPVVGNLFVPIAGMHFAPSEVAWFFFSIGIVFWLVLMTIVFYRLFFHDPLPARLMPTLFILLAPPAVGFISYVALANTIDGFARVLYYTALFLALLLGSNVIRFVKNAFYISAWAYSFPLAAMTIATFVMASKSGLGFFNGLGAFFLTVVSLIVTVLLVKTFDAIRRHAICVPE